jgi:4-aminobutyrate aminotransferase
MTHFLRNEGDINLTEERKQWYQNLDDKAMVQVVVDSKLFIHQSLSTPCIDVLSECEGSYIITSKGEKILDFHGNNLHQVGYKNPAVINAVKEALDTLPFCPRRYTNGYAIELATKLTALVPGLTRVLFAPGGSEANSMALKLARLVTGKHKVVSMWGSFHGGGLDTISVGGEAIFRKNAGPLMSGVEHVPQPDSYRPLWPNDPDQDIYISYIRHVFEHEGDVGALIAETIRNTDVQIPTVNFWKKLRALCDEFGVVLILDEIPIAFGRTGKFFAFQHFEIVPDIVTIGKALGGGVFPMAAVITSERFNCVAENSVGHFTHEKSPLGSAAGVAVLKYIEDKKLIQKSVETGNYLHTRLKEMQQRYEKIGDIRGSGLLWGLDLVTDRSTKNRACEEAEKIMYYCIKNGLSFKVSQGNVLCLAPPLTISSSELEHALTVLEAAFQTFLS